MFNIIIVIYSFIVIRNFVLVLVSFLFSDSIINTALWDSWKSYKLDIPNLEPSINKKLLHSLCMNNVILAFTYDIIRNKKTRKLMTIFKVLPSPKIKSLRNIWKKYYTDPDELTNIELDFNVYLCKEIVLTFLPNANNIKCSECSQITFQEEAYCINEKCSKFAKFIDYKKYISNDRGKVLKTLEDLLSEKTDNLICKQCINCKVCKRMDVKCKRHKVCTHFNTSRQYFHMLNKLAYKYSSEDV
ncbi:hypothetical protein PmNV_108 [Penaeus monodon nudivirus]|uniref:Uncharacterized protein n=1 Tax=Penaeus monodon nudivirus TaxID=1529056 RepID=A0A076FJ22_9VIRU|nr:hypothetical protein PmNV_108 [Penaeus monodon nudivirus]AII15896.1 hypothetical protein PmNV_108 [Penaeus monodon nudivirus]